jgi:hypothetical protein
MWKQFGGAKWLRIDAGEISTCFPKYWRTASCGQPRIEIILDGWSLNCWDGWDTVAPTTWHCLRYSWISNMQHALLWVGHVSKALRRILRISPVWYCCPWNALLKKSWTTGSHWSCKRCVERVDIGIGDKWYVYVKIQQLNQVEGTWFSESQKTVWFCSAMVFALIEHQVLFVKPLSGWGHKYD